MLLHPPLLVFFIILFGIFFAGTILIVKNEKKYNTRKITNKYKIIQGFITVLIILLKLPTNKPIINRIKSPKNRTKK